MECNPLLEALGNAQTTRNSNSSRFGQWLTIRFENDGTVLGARIESYLLERSRLVERAEAERNFHIFYQVSRPLPASAFALRPPP